MSFLVLDKLVKVFADGTPAVQGIDLAVRKGEFIVLLGPSGCGKTTTLRMVAGLEQPTGGTITLDGADVTRLPPSQRDVGFVFQFYALYPHLSVRQNLLFPLECAGVGRTEAAARVSALAERFALSDLLARRPQQLSGGDQQRVALARAMIRSPRLWLMDEPLGTLDADRRLELREVIRAAQLQAGITTLYVTHDQEEAMALADRVVVMDGGLIQQAGPPAEVYDRPANLFVAQFVGSPGMNFLPGAVQADGGRSWFVPTTGAGLRFALPAAVRPGPATLGVRPEFVVPDPAGPLAGTVAVCEYLGGHAIAHVDTPAGRLSCRVPAAAAPAAGQALRLGFDPAHVRLFDPFSGAALGAGPPPATGP